MAAPDPPKFQYPYNMRTTVTPNQQAAGSPYVDTSITKQNVAQPGGFTPTDAPPRATARTELGNTRPAYAADTEPELDSPAGSGDGAAAPPDPPVLTPGKFFDPYSNTPTQPPG